MSMIVYPVMSQPTSKCISKVCYMVKRRQRVVSMYLYQTLKTSATIAGQHSPRINILNVPSSPIDTLINITRCASVLRKLSIQSNKSPTEKNENITSETCSVKVAQNGVPGTISDCLYNSPVRTYSRRSQNLTAFLVGDNTPMQCRLMSTYCSLQRRTLSPCVGRKTLEPTVFGSTRSTSSGPESGSKTSSGPESGSKTSSGPESGSKTSSGPESGSKTSSVSVSASKTSSGSGSGSKTSSGSGSVSKTSPGPGSGSKMLKLAVIGAAGGLGQPLSLMLKQSPLIDELALYDVNSTRGMGLDISHVDTKCKVHAYSGECELEDALRGACIVMIVTGCCPKPDLDRETQFTNNAELIQSLTETCGNVCPNAVLAIMTEPVTSMVPVAVEVLRKCGQYSPSKVIGVTALDGVRTNTFTAEVLGKPPENVLVPVIGGCSGPSAVPLFSQTRPRVEFSCAEVQRLTQLVQEAGLEVIRAKSGRSTPSLALAFAAARFAISLCRGACGQSCVVECAYVRSDVLCDCPYLTTPVELGPGGVQRNLGLPKLSDVEKCLLQRSVKILQEDIRKGTCFVIGDAPPPKECPDEPDTPPMPPKRQCLTGPKPTSSDKL